MSPSEPGTITARVQPESARGVRAFFKDSLVGGPVHERDHLGRLSKRSATMVWREAYKKIFGFTNPPDARKWTLLRYSKLHELGLEIQISCQKCINY